MPRTLLPLIFLALAAPAGAADYSDPTWPCIQRKVERLSPALMWNAVIEPMEMEAETARAVDRLGATLSLRRLTDAELQSAIDSFTADHGTDPALLAQAFQSVFDRMAGRRSEIMKGIEEYSLGQIALSEKIDTDRTAFEAEETKEAPDFDRMDALEEQIAWDERIYTDRQKSLTYVCETPTLLEKRLYHIAQMLQSAGS